MTKLHWRLLLIAVTVVLAVWLLFPTFVWYRLPVADREKRESMKDPILSKIINLGLDLRGGTHLVLELDTSKLTYKTVEEQKHAVTEASDRVIETLRNRIDQFGVAEALIAKQGEKWIVVQLPGVKDPERAKELIGKTALLEFKLVHEGPEMSNIISKLNEKSISISSATANPHALPKDVLALFPTGYILSGGKEGRTFLVKANPEMTGSSLVDAKVQLGGSSGMGYPEVSIEFNQEGAVKFAQVTEMNINHNLAIVLDGVVQSAPVIRTRIPDGKAVIEGQFSAEDAKLLSTVLRAGALPVPVKVIEERTVGPSLGEDSIKAGVMSTTLGFLLVVLFMFAYYRGAGFVTDMALLLNFVLILGWMAYVQATLTLPGIAGIILSLGMAVDANVLILERTREELRNGKTVRMAIDLGYDKAWTAILDSNLTTIISAACLYQFGTGPIKGFAVTLFVGLVVSMYTAIFVTRTYYIWRTQDRDFTEMSI